MDDKQPSHPNQEPPPLIAGMADMWRAAYAACLQEMRELQANHDKDYDTLKERCELLKDQLSDSSARADMYKQAYEILDLDYQRLMATIEDKPKTKKQRTPAKKGA